MTEQISKEKIYEIKQRARDFGLIISRIPEKTRSEFKEWCKDEFAGDYGMGLKWLWDLRKGMFASPNEEVNQKIDILADEVSQLKSQPVEEPKKKVIRSVSGKVITEKKEE